MAVHTCPGQHLSVSNKHNGCKQSSYDFPGLVVYLSFKAPSPPPKLCNPGYNFWRKAICSLISKRSPQPIATECLLRHLFEQRTRMEGSLSGAYWIRVVREGTGQSKQ